MSYDHIFGPVLSRRLGVSLGVDLVTHKICSMDCIYCECGKTTLLTCDRNTYVPFEKVTAELDDFFARHPDPDYITFSGSGEPSLNINIGKVIAHIKACRPKIRTAVLTNSGLFSDRKVRKELLAASLVVPSLDAAVHETFEKINRPCASMDINAIIEGLTAFRAEYTGQMWLEILILPGINDDENDLLHLKQAVHKIRPDRVQLNTLDRPGTKKDIRPATRKELERVINAIDFDPVEIVASVVDSAKAAVIRTDMEAAILETIHRRPCTARDLAGILGVEQSDVEQCLLQLEATNKVVASKQDRGIFYQTCKGKDQ